MTFIPMVFNTGKDALTGKESVFFVILGLNLMSSVGGYEQCPRAVCSTGTNPSLNSTGL